MEKKQTPIDWLEDIIGKMEAQGGDLPPLKVHIQKAKQMFQEQIEQAVTHGNRQEVYDATETLGKKYFNETFKK
jgi:hypothetical protein